MKKMIKKNFAKSIIFYFIKQIFNTFFLIFNRFFLNKVYQNAVCDLNIRQIVFFENIDEILELHTNK